VPWLRRLVDGLLTAETRARCGINCGQSGTGSELSPSTYTVPVSIITLMLRTRLSLNSGFTRRANGRNLGTFKQSNALDRKVLSYCFSAYKNTLRGYFESWKAHMEKSVASNRNSFEGVKCRCSNSLIKSCFETSVFF
jgi:hypothetical protein